MLVKSNKKKIMWFVADKNYICAIDSTNKYNNIKVLFLMICHFVLCDKGKKWLINVMTVIISLIYLYNQVMLIIHYSNGQ